MRVRRSCGAAGVVVLLLAPTLVAASDPRGDTIACRSGEAVTDHGVPDLVDATGSIVERERGLSFEITFAEPLLVPDREGHPFRVDVVLRDPDLPASSFAYYRGINRILRYDAIPQPRIDIILIPERGQNVFDAVEVRGRRLTLTVPGRTVTLDRDLEGLGLERFRWGVIVRDEASCDVLGDGRPSERLVDKSGAGPTVGPVVAGSSWSIGWVLPIVIGAVVVLVAAGALLRVRRRRTG